MNVLRKPEPVFITLPAFYTKFWHAKPVPATTALFRNNVNLVEALDETHTRHPDATNLRVISAAASTGAEADSLLALHNASEHPARIILEGIDINPALVSAARTAKHLTNAYSTDNREADMVNDRLLEAGFNVMVGDETNANISFHVDPTPIRERHTTLFHLGSAASAPIAPADLIMANNLLFHLTPTRAFEVIDNLATSIAPDGVLSIGGSPVGGLMARLPDVFGYRMEYDDWLGQAGERLVSEHGMTALEVTNVLEVTHPTLFARD